MYYASGCMASKQDKNISALARGPTPFSVVTVAYKKEKTLGVYYY